MSGTGGFQYVYVQVYGSGPAEQWKNTGCLGYIGDDKLPTYKGISHEIRIPTKNNQDSMKSIRFLFFFVAHLDELPQAVFLVLFTGFSLGFLPTNYMTKIWVFNLFGPLESASLKINKKITKQPISKRCLSTGDSSILWKRNLNKN